MANTKISVGVGSAIRAQRTSIGISQDKLADKIGMHRAYYSAIERGEKNITLDTLSRVASGLDTEPSMLLKSAGY